MITPSIARKILGKSAQNLTDKQLEILLSQLYTLAELAVSTLQKNPKWIKTLKE